MRMKPSDLLPPTGPTSSQTLLTDPAYAAAAIAVGGELTGIEEEPGRERVIFIFAGLKPTFLEDVVGGRVVVEARVFIAAGEHMKSLLAQIRARRGRQGR